MTDPKDALAAANREETRRVMEFARLHPVPASVWSTTVTPLERERVSVGWLTRRARRSNRSRP